MHHLDWWWTATTDRVVHHRRTTLQLYDQNQAWFGGSPHGPCVLRKGAATSQCFFSSWRICCSMIWRSLSNLHLASRQRDATVVVKQFRTWFVKWYLRQFVSQPYTMYNHLTSTCRKIILWISNYEELLSPGSSNSSIACRMSNFAMVSSSTWECSRQKLSRQVQPKMHGSGGNHRKPDRLKHQKTYYVIRSIRTVGTTWEDQITIVTTGQEWIWQDAFKNYCVRDHAGSSGK